MREDLNSQRDAVNVGIRFFSGSHASAWNPYGMHSHAGAWE